MDIKIRTGDIVLWRTTNWNDILYENLIMIDGLHTGIALVGESFELLSSFGKSPSNVYTTYLLDYVFPIEEVIRRIWVSKRGVSMYHIARQNGPEIDENVAFDTLLQYLNMEKLSGLYAAHIGIMAFFRYGGALHESGYNNKRWNICSLLPMYILWKLDLLLDNAQLNNVLPIDYKNLSFYQKYSYEVDTIFDKKTSNLDWCLYKIVRNLFQESNDPIRSERVERLLKNYHR